MGIPVGYRKISTKGLNISVREEVCQGPDQNLRSKGEVFLSVFGGFRMDYFSHITHRNISF